MTTTSLMRWTTLALLLLCVVPANGADPNDQPGAKDPPIFTRMPGFHIYNAEEHEFDRQTFLVARGKEVAVEGRRYMVNYYLNEGAKTPSGLQIVRNYTNASKAAGGQTVYEYEDGGMEHAVLKLSKGNSEYWTAVEAGGNGMYRVIVVERQSMNQDVTANADAWAGSLRETGKATVYGIHFDTGKSTIKPESETAIGEIAKLLKADPKLKLHVVGHTDSVGTLGDNMKLSQGRAAAVVQTLVTTHGVAATRLEAHGVGPLAPVLPNDSEDGRAKNRRVELVKQ